MLLSDNEKKVLDFLVTNFSNKEKPIPFHEDDLKIQNLTNEEMREIVEHLYEKGLVFISNPEKSETGEVKIFEQQPFVLAPDAIYKDYD